MDMQCYEGYLYKKVWKEHQREENKRYRPDFMEPPGASNRQEAPEVVQQLADSSIDDFQIDSVSQFATGANQYDLPK